MRIPSRAPRGFTLIDVAIAMALVAILVSAALPSLAMVVETRRLEGVAQQLALDLHEARAAALRRGDGVRVRVAALPSGSCWVLHTGAADACSCTPAGAATCAPGASALRAVLVPAVTKVQVRANVPSIRFDPLHGTATPAGTLTVAAASGREVHHVVNIAGRVRSCTPSAVAAPVPGYRAC